MGISIADILGGGTLSAVNNIIRDFKGDPNAKSQLQELVTQNEAQFKLADLEAEVKLNDIAGQNIRAEAQSASWLARNARPLSIVIITCLITFNYMIPTITGIFHYALVPIALPDWLYKAYLAGFLGYTAGRTTEKCLNADN